MLHLRDMERKKELSLFFIGFPVFIPLAWLVKRTQNVQTQSQEGHTKNEIKSHTYQAPSWTFTWRSSSSNKKCFLFNMYTNWNYMYYPFFFFLVETSTGHYVIVVRIKNRLKSLWVTHFCFEDICTSTFCQEYGELLLSKDLLINASSPKSPQLLL